MSFGLGFIADGLLKGQERNRNWGLRQKQEERSQAADQRAEESHGIGMRIGGVNAAMAEEKMTPDAIQQRQEHAGLGLDLAKQTLDNSQRQGFGIQQQNELRAEDLTPEAVSRRREAANLELEAKRQANQYNEYRNTEAGRKVSEEALAWDKRFSEIVNQKNEEVAKVELADAIDMKRYRMFQLLESGDQAGFAMLINSAKDNKLEDVVGGRITPDGRVQGVNAKGEIVVDIPKDEVDGLKNRMKQRQIDSKKEPKITMVPIYNDMGDKIGERPAITETDSETGEQYIKYLEERKEPTSSSISDEEEVDYARNMVKDGEMTPEQFQRIYHQAYTPNQNNIQQPSVNKPRQDDYDVDIPLIF